MPEFGAWAERWWIPVLFVVIAGHITNVCVTLFLHRAQTHRGVRLHALAAVPMRVWLWLTTAIVTKEWVACHRKHHAFADREGDPHSPLIEGLRNIMLKGAFYYHNDAKNDLVEQCFEETWAAIRAVQAAAMDRATDGLTSLASQAAHLVEGQVSGEGVLLRTSALAAVPEEMRFRLLAGFDRATFHFASVVSDGISDGSVRAVDVPLAAQMIAGGVNAASELRHWARGITPKQAVEAYVRPLFTGLLEP